MKSLRKVRPDRGLELRDAPMPVPGADEVLVQVKATGVCGTDLHIDKWTASYHFMTAALPVTIGHEFSGVVTALGEGVQGLKLGQLVTVRPSVVCNVCEACMAGRPDDCVTRKGIGVSRDGAFADFVRAPARNCIPIPDGVDAQIAALAEPLSVSWEAVRAAGVQPGDRVLVLGPGNIGQGIALFAREAGAAEVVVAGHGDAPRLQILRKLGFDQLIDFAEVPMSEALAKAATPRLFDVVIEATGVAAVIQPALQVLKSRGVLVITGIHSAPVAIDLAALVRKHHEIRGSYRAPEAAWPQVVAFMAHNQAMLAHMVTHTVPLSRALEGFELANNKTATKVMVLPDAAEETLV
ncbi:zinc-binding dehydrogenase [Hydrogenophaga sp.]|uniref:zinc-dependent alcohol dehydrogenase n=1 Tax=Hydrogenophaga sp. TaxID=1904254 RepID=UPI0027258A4B|nr:alcohol dehydrogenase catalytic domain-containing protein [Hydrogenophaga sp.]MDO9435171.1 alcohol dehydrogenase catalytic domain-containing protein [Hydrogenophaga sp.]